MIDVKFTHKADHEPPPSAAAAAANSIPGLPGGTSPLVSAGAAEAAAAAIRHGIDDLDFELDQGKLVCILGPPGAGKSTVLRLLAYMVFPDHDSPGTIFVPPHLRAVQIQQDPSMWVLYEQRLRLNLQWNQSTHALRSHSLLY